MIVKGKIWVLPREQCGRYTKPHLFWTDRTIDIMRKVPSLNLEHLEREKVQILEAGSGGRDGFAFVVGKHIQ